jgi:hypothetical protein
MMVLIQGGFVIEECGGHGDGNWEDPMLSVRSDSLERAVEILSAHAPDAGKVTPEQIKQVTLNMARSFESYLSGGEFMPVEPPPADGALY